MTGGRYLQRSNASGGRSATTPALRNVYQNPQVFLTPPSSTLRRGNTPRASPVQRSDQQTGPRPHAWLNGLFPRRTQQPSSAATRSSPRVRDRISQLPQESPSAQRNNRRHGVSSQQPGNHGVTPQGQVSNAGAGVNVARSESSYRSLDDIQDPMEIAIYFRELFARLFANEQATNFAVAEGGLDVGQTYDTNIRRVCKTYWVRDDVAPQTRKREIEEEQRSYNNKRQKLDAQRGWTAVLAWQGRDLVWNPAIKRLINENDGNLPATVQQLYRNNMGELPEDDAQTSLQQCLANRWLYTRQLEDSSEISKVAWVCCVLYFFRLSTCVKPYNWGMSEGNEWKPSALPRMQKEDVLAMVGSSISRLGSSTFQPEEEFVIQKVTDWRREGHRLAYVAKRLGLGAMMCFAMNLPRSHWIKHLTLGGDLCNKAVRYCRETLRIKQKANESSVTAFAKECWRFAFEEAIGMYIANGGIDETGLEWQMAFKGPVESVAWGAGW